MNYLESLKEMKFNVDARSLLLGSAAGILAGCGATYLVCRHAMASHYYDLLDEEVAKVKAHYNEQLKDQLSAAASLTPESGTPFVGRPGEDGLVAGEDDYGNDGPAPVGDRAEISVGEFRITDPLEGLDDESDDGDDEEDLYEDASPAPLVNRDIRKPYIISAEEFADTPPEWQRLTITYFAGDNVLVDDKNEPIQLVNKTTGKLSPLSFGGRSGDPHLCYIRNQTLEVDFEVVLDHRSYADAILHYGNPRRGS